VTPIKTFEDLLATARDFEDEPLETVTGQLFTVWVFRDRELVFTPVSTGNRQSDGRKAQERFLVDTRQLEACDPRTTPASAGMPLT